VTRRTPLIAVALAAFAASTALPAAAARPTLSADVIDRVLLVSGSPFAEQITLRLSALDPTQLQVDVGNDGSPDETFALSTFNVIDVAAGGGDDIVRIDQTNGAFTTTIRTRIAGENGDDSLFGGSGDELFLGGNGDDFVDGNGGADTAFLGRGDDVFVWDPGDASDIVEGEAGSDTMVFNGAGGNEIMAATADGGRVLFTREPGTIEMDLDDVEVVDVRTLGGADSVTVFDLGATDLKRVDIDLAAALGGSASDGVADTVTVEGTKADDTIAVDANDAAVEVSGLAPFVRITHADPALDRLVINAESGDDVVSLDPALPGLILVSVL
jgi:Ca2+-binding RTX toxin-like protein